MPAPSVAVCIPTYNRRDYLQELLQAFAQQDGASEIQVVVSDNASTDGTQELCRELALTWPQLKYVRLPENLGPDANFLSCVQHADTEFCWLFGSDDAPRPGAVLRVLDLLAQDPDILLFDRVWCDIAMHPTRVDRFLDCDAPARFDTGRGPDLGRYLGAATGLCGLLSFLSSVVVRKRRWDGTPSMDRYAGSAYIHTAKLLSVVSQGAELLYVREPLVLCRGDNEGLMEHGLFNRARIDFVWYRALIDQFFPRPPAHAAADSVVRREYGLLRLLLLLCEAQGDEPEELLRHMRAFGYDRTMLAAVGLPARSESFRSVLRAVMPMARRAWWWRTRRATATALG